MDREESVPPVSDPRDASFLWRCLIVGMLVLLAVDLGGIMYSVVDNRGAAVVTALSGLFTTMLAGLLSLFISPPTAAQGRARGPY